MQPSTDAHTFTFQKLSSYKKIQSNIELLFQYKIIKSYINMYIVDKNASLIRSVGLKKNLNIKLSLFMSKF